MINDHIICAIMATIVYSDALICTQPLQLSTHNFLKAIPRADTGCGKFSWGLCRLDKIMPGMEKLQKNSC